jgi:RND family efflux transporter MFP subunit
MSPCKVEAVYETSGTVRAGVTSNLASRVFGTVTKVHVKEGDRVRAGDILAAIDNRDARQRMNAAEAGFNEASKAREAAATQSGLADITSRRYANLYKEKVVSQQEFDQIEAQKNVAALELERAALAAGRAKALLEEARVHFGFTEIRAPFAGIVTAKKIEQGAMATPGMHLFTVEDTSGFKIDAPVDERLSGRLNPGLPVKIRFEATGETAAGTITKVVPAIDPATRSFIVEAALKDKALRSGQYAKVLIPEGTKEVLLVPATSIVEKGRLTGVYAVDDKGVVNYRLIRKGAVFEGGVEVLSGVRGGDRIIVGGVEKAVDGGIVKDR